MRSLSGRLRQSGRCRDLASSKTGNVGLPTLTGLIEFAGLCGLAFGIGAGAGLDLKSSHFWTAEAIAATGDKQQIVNRSRKGARLAAITTDPLTRSAGVQDGFGAMEVRGPVNATITIRDVAAPNLAFTANAHSQARQRPVGYADIVEKVKPAVISIRVKVDTDKVTVDDGGPVLGNSPLGRLSRPFGKSDYPQGSSNLRGPNLMIKQGSGFFISADGYAVTNGHVVENTKATEITTDANKSYSAKVIGIDLRTDIALIKVEGTGFPFVKFAEGKPRIGDLVLAIGNPFGLEGTVTAGIVSARGRHEGPYKDFLQIDASINSGNSGGPSFDIEGNVVGVNTAILTPSGGSVGVAFAVPAEIVKDVVTELKGKGVVSRGWIGVQTQDITPEIADGLGLNKQRGALVAEPQANGPAAKYRGR